MSKKELTLEWIKHRSKTSKVWYDMLDFIERATPIERGHTLAFVYRRNQISIDDFEKNVSSNTTK